jgi:hypothetical protein
LIAISVDRHFLAVPDPAPLFVCVVAFAASLSGLGSGMISTAIAVAASALFVLNHRATPWVWGRPPKTPHHRRRLFCYRLLGTEH